ncbi:quorum-quenching N-acyl homoserine lactonase AiiA [Alicyclobacillus mengziensis]|uniref:quorum-quenching N-acyl-homoserine lactonase n=1 Tax=Alicyclobacillus mengziensis TaxID=2931921 RepID=A0A9X7VXX5_9BACL|nr:N-acyl homoserine lactonase family protein [Alicyclobacillus mengziensis]QSO46882.1 N-acyl homoserine lactonase family protein [Alicyclobacillus mengziensis]
MSVQKLSLLPAGYCLVDASALDTRRKVGEMARLPIWSYLIETSDGPILIDTGMPESCIHEPAEFFRGTEDEGLIVPEMKAQDLITNVIGRCGYQPSDLVCVVSTHLHFDHAGGNQLFPYTEIVLQRAEYEAALKQDNYFDICKDPALLYRFVDGDTELVPGVQLVFTPGHTPGHQSVLVSTPNDTILLAIDAAYHRPNYEDGVPFAVRDAEKAFDSIAKLKRLTKETSAKVFFGHDAGQAEEWKVYPESY